MAEGRPVRRPAVPGGAVHQHGQPVPLPACVSPARPPRRSPVLECARGGMDPAAGLVGAGPARRPCAAGGLTGRNPRTRVSFLISTYSLHPEQISPTPHLVPRRCPPPRRGPRHSSPTTMNPKNATALFSAAAIALLLAPYRMDAQ